MSYRREEDHDRVVRSMYEDMESQLKEEREKRQALVNMHTNTHTINMKHGFKFDKPLEGEMLLFVLENSPSIRGNDDIVHGGYYHDGDGDYGNER